MNILLVDDELESRNSIAEFLRECGHKVIESSAGHEAIKILSTGELHLVLSDIRMPKVSGIELLRQIRLDPGLNNVTVILFTGNGDVHTAIEALRAGAYDYLLKPINIEELVNVIGRVEEYQLLKQENNILNNQFNAAVKAATKETKDELIRIKKAYSQCVGLGQVGIFSGTMQEVISQARKLHADRSIPVLIEGETGTGKELIARYIHFGDGEVTMPFVDLNCAALSANIFESELFGYVAGAFTGGLPKGQKGKMDLAAGGTLFLDEITEIPVSLQAKLLRVIQEKEFYRVGGLKKIKSDVRIICTTNQNVKKCVQQGGLRRDLYYRLNVGYIYIPPLRQRKEAIIKLAEMFLTGFAREKGKKFKAINQEAAHMLQSYHWPGNVRELKNTMEWVVLMWDDNVLKPSHLGILQNDRFSEPAAERIDPDTIDYQSFVLPDNNLPLEEYTNKIILKALELKKGNKTDAAKYLGISRRSLYCRLKHIEGWEE